MVGVPGEVVSVGNRFGTMFFQSPSERRLIMDPGAAGDFIKELDESRDNWSVFLTYDEASKYRTFIDKIREALVNISVVTSDESISDLSLASTGVKIIRVGDFPELLSRDELVEAAMKDIVHAHQVIVVAREWEEICLDNQRPRWCRWDEEISLNDGTSLSTAVHQLHDEADILNPEVRRILLRYLQESRFRQALQGSGIRIKQTIEDLIDRYAIRQLSQQERKFFENDNDAIFRGLVAEELGHDADMRNDLQEFYGTPPAINFEVDSEHPTYKAFYDEVEARPTDIKSTTAIEQALAVLVADAGDCSDIAAGLENIVDELSDSGLSKIEAVVEDVSFLNRTRFIADLCSASTLSDRYRQLATIVGIHHLENGNVAGFKEALKSYRAIQSRAEKAPITRTLCSLFANGELTQPTPATKIADFLNEDGAKVVVVVDSMEATTETMMEKLDQYSSRAEVTLDFLYSTVPTLTDTFRHDIDEQFDLSQVAGYVNEDEDGLQSPPLSDFLSEGNHSDELVEMLLDGESVIIYENKPDKDSTFSGARERIISQQLGTIQTFISDYSDFADIMITADHGMVEVFPGDAIEQPSQASKRGHTSDCRVSFGREELQESGCETIEITHPMFDSPCYMLNPSNPHVRIGTHEDRSWTHGGISVEEFIVPMITWRD